MAPAATQETPVVPPRPSKSQERDSMPKVPPRPVRRIDRSVSPNPDRFAPSPLNEGLLAKGPRSNRLSAGYYGSRLERPGSVEIPSHAGEEGMEYENLAGHLGYEDLDSSPEQTRTVGDDIKLHAPKPSLPAQSAKQRVAQVTRTDSERAASFGIGRPGSAAEQNQTSSGRSLKKKASTTSQLSNTESHHAEDEHGIPEIGQQVPMFPNAGDVQAPSPAPGATFPEGVLSKHHKRRTSARGNLPPGSYGLHGHGVQPQDRLEKAYFDKHPGLLKKEHTPHHYDRPQDFSMSSEDLNKIVRETASRGSGLGPHAGTPSDQVGWQAIEESVSRPGSVHPTSPTKRGASSIRSISSQAEEAGHRGPEEGHVIHVDEPDRRRSVMFSEDEGAVEEEYAAPILAEDEVLKGSSAANGPAVEPRRLSAYEEDSSSRPSSRQNSRPGSMYKEMMFEHVATPLEDVEEYEPLFPEDDKPNKAASEKPAASAKQRPQSFHKQRFPSRDIWEDAPDSVHYTVEVSAPEAGEEKGEEGGHEQESGSKPETRRMPPPRDGESPAQAFARHQEELAEQEAGKYGADTFLKQSQKPTWAQHQSHLQTEKPAGRPESKQRFPSQDVWEDTPDSLMLETTVSGPQAAEVESPVEAPGKAEVPDRRPVRKPTDPSVDEKPAVPERPKRSGSADDGTSAPTTKPTIPDRPKPQVPIRPVKAGPTSGGLEPAEAAAPPKQKPAVPARPLGGKIAALQGNFLNDLNKKLGLGPQAPKKEEAAAAEEEKQSEEKAPLVDARKTRARGPQRRAPAAASKSPSPGPANDDKPKFTLGFVVPATVFEIDPEEEVAVKVGGAVAREAEDESAEEAPEEKEPAAEPEAEKQPEVAEKQPEETAEASGSVLESVKDGLAALVGKTTSHEQEEEKHDEEQEAEEAEAEEESPKQETEAETKSLVTNTAGETILSEQVKEEDGKVEPVGVEQ